MISNFEKKYKIKGKISEGAFGQIYIIEDKKVNTEYVLKKIMKKDPEFPDVILFEFEDFEKEIVNLKKIKGTNIINIIDYYYDDNFYYIIFEKMDGDLNQLLMKEYKNGMSSNMIRKIFKQLNSALYILYKKEICHRDLKPENILYSYTNYDKTDFIVKLGDFGLSTKLSDKSEYRTTNAGTPYYRAPEVEVEDAKYSNKCDLYSIGVILYKLKTGELIFVGNKRDEIKNNKKNGKLKKKTDDDKLNDLISKLVVNDPHKRLNWMNYFNHPFFKENDNNNQKGKNNFNLKIIIK